jgi:ATP-dependent Clp protease ATP-binding subunit ClpB
VLVIATAIGIGLAAFVARPLRRLIQSAIGDQLARMLLGGEVGDGGKVTVDVKDGRLILTPA